MPARKSSRTRSRNVTRSSRQSNSEMSYDTKVILVILLLLFVYPIGLILMWVWMDKWPLWLKIIISLPVVFFLVMILFVFVVIGTIIRRSGQNYYYRSWNNAGNMMYQTVSPSPSPFDVSPTPQTYNNNY